MSSKLTNIVGLRERERESSKQKLVVWALYDDAESSYKKAIQKYFDGQFEVHCFGINDITFPENEGYFYHLIDLSLNNFNLIKQMSSFPKPDIILASPPCESWSGADCGGKMIRSIDKDNHWIVRNSKYYEEYNKTCHPVKRRYFIQKERGRIIGESTVGGTIEIIQYFKPKYWAIENPKTSKTWEYQENHWNFLGYMNDVYYSTYDQRFSLKPTIFKSNIKINFEKERVSGNSKHMALGSYAMRSRIPLRLIKDIIEQILNDSKNEE